MRPPPRHTASSSLPSPFFTKENIFREQPEKLFSPEKERNLAPFFLLLCEKRVFAKNSISTASWDGFGGNLTYEPPLGGEGLEL